jgi:spore maturation protein CgeB
LTDSSPLLENQFKNGRDLVFYEYQNLDKLTEQIFDLLNSPNQLSEISQNGYFQAKENHSWQARAAYLLSIL